MSGGLRTVAFKPSYWAYEETDDNELIFHVSGLTKKQKTVQVKILGYHPEAYLELPRTVDWNETKCKVLLDAFQGMLKTKAPIVPKRISSIMHARDNLYGKAPMNALKLSFPTQSAAYDLQRKFTTKYGGKYIYIEGLGNMEKSGFRLHQHNLDPVLKYTASRKLQLSDYMTVTETIPADEKELDVEERKFSYNDIDMYVKHDQVTSSTEEEIDLYDGDEEGLEEVTFVRQKYMSFDIECYSFNHNSKLPDPEFTDSKYDGADNEEDVSHEDLYPNVIFQFVATFGRIGDPDEKRRKVCVSLFNPHDLEGCEVIRCKTEKELLLTFTRLVQEENPDIFITYNGMKFDWNYMLVRATKLGCYPRFMELSRLIGVRAKEATIKWSSSAYGNQEFLYADCHGRVNIDVLLEIERNPPGGKKLPHYSLNYVSERYLGDKKKDISPREMFMFFKMTKEILPQVEGVLVSKSKLRTLKRRIRQILERRRMHGVAKEYRAELLRATPENIEDIVRKAMTLILDYCKKDTILPIRLVEKLNLCTTMEQMSNVMNVPVSYLHTRGQQIKVLSMIYREALKNFIIIPYRGKEEIDEKYQGAIVIKAVPGDYDNVSCLDFASLYPSTMIAYNICYTTLVKDESVPDSECHVLDWEDHVGCEHDPQKRKKKAEDILCGHHHYRFRKVQIVIKKDGTVKYLHEGLMPRMERNLLATRKEIKKEMFKAKARLNMQRGKATESDIAYYRKCGWEIIEAGALSSKEEKVLEMVISVLDAKQQAVKVSANSCYGALGAKTGFIPFIPGAASVTAMGRFLITKAIDRILEEYSFARLIYGDTDSCMIKFEGHDLEQSFDLAEEASRIATHYLKCYIIGVDEGFTVRDRKTKKRYRLDEVSSKDDIFGNLSEKDRIKVLEYEATPIDLEFENMYGRFFLLTKKRYVAYIVNKKGEVVDVTKKGVVLTRRDNCKYLRNTYENASKGVLERKSEQEIMYNIYDSVHALFTRQIPDTDLIIYMGVKDVVSYAKKREEKVGGNVVATFYIGKDGKEIPSDDITGPKDERLEYRNLPQALLALKMIKRGTDVPPNTRLEFLYLENPEATHQGEKAEDYTYYKENKDLEGFHPDYLHYLEKQLTKPLTELLLVKFPRNNIIYDRIDDTPAKTIKNKDGTIQRRVPKKPGKLNRLLDHPELDEFKRSMVGTRSPSNMVKSFTKRVDSISFDETLIGWDAMEIECSDEWVKKCQDEYLVKEPSIQKTWNGVYNFRGLKARVEFILESTLGERENEFDFDPNDEIEVDLVDTCKRWKARQVLDDNYKHYGMKKRPTRRPTQSGDKLRTNVKVILMKDIGGHPKGSIGKILTLYEQDDYTYCYDLLMNEEEEIILKNVHRRDVATFYVRDSKVMKDMLVARKNYRQVVDELTKMWENHFRSQVVISSKPR